jgi:hypothetical protein
MSIVDNMLPLFRERMGELRGKDKIWSHDINFSQKHIIK